jgi:hypothetical protein
MNTQYLFFFVNNNNESNYKFYLKYLTKIYELKLKKINDIKKKNFYIKR